MHVVLVPGTRYVILVLVPGTYILRERYSVRACVRVCVPVRVIEYDHSGVLYWILYMTYEIC